MRSRGSVKVGQDRDGAGESGSAFTEAQRQRAFLYLHPGPSSGASKSDPASGSIQGDRETQPNLDGPEGAQATPGNSLITPLE